MTKSNKFSHEVRERAVRMVQEHWGDYPSLWAAVELIAPKIGCVAGGRRDVGGRGQGRITAAGRLTARRPQAGRRSVKWAP